MRIQWDPERDPHGAPQPWRSIQIGLSGQAVRHFVDDWIVRISDITPQVAQMATLLDAGETAQVLAMLPPERPYFLQPGQGDVPIPC